MMLMERIYWFDDPCATFPVNGLSGIWVRVIEIIVLLLTLENILIAIASKNISFLDFVRIFQSQCLNVNNAVYLQDLNESL